MLRRVKGRSIDEAAALQTNPNPNPNRNQAADLQTLFDRIRR